MAITSVSLSRVSQNMQANLLTNGIQQNMAQLLQEEECLSTGSQIILPSDNPISASAVIRMDGLLGSQQQYLTNMDNASKIMSTADSTLGSVNSLVTQAQNLALANVGSTATAAQQQAASTLVNSIIGQLVTLGNTQYLGSYIFAGRNNTVPPYAEDGNTVKFSGDTQNITTQVAPDISENVSLTANEVFGSGSGIVQGYQNLAPAADMDTRLTDISGALGQGIRLGTLSIVGSSIGQVNVDLSGSTSLGDVIQKINSTLPSSVQASLSTDGRHLVLTSTNSGETLKVLETGQGTTAHDLGLYNPVAQSGPVTSSDIAPELTLQTPVSALNGGAGIDLNSGIVIKNGDNSITVNFGSANTMQDILNTINTSGVGVQARINDAGTGIEVINELAGTQLTIGENGGTTADDLGIRTLRGATPLSSLNNGSGISPVAGDDFQITTSDGSVVSVDADGAVTFQDMIDKINAAATGAGVALTAGLATTGNGIVLTDNTGGTGTFHVDRANLSNVAQDLGILKTAAAGSNQIVGDDVNPTTENSIFTDLVNLRNALQNNDNAGIQTAGQNIQNYIQQLSQAQGKLGFMEQGMQNRQTSTQDAVTSTQALVSNLKDLDYTQAITQFQTMQTTLQANLQVGGKILQMSLLDYLT